MSAARDELADYLSAIRFRYLPPEQPRPRGFRALNLLLRRIGLHLEMWNTALPDDAAMRRRLAPACRVPRMSTFAIGAVINKAVSLLPPGEVFLNVGVWNGFTLLAGMAGNPQRRCIGVDNFSHKNSPREAFLKRFRAARGPAHEFHTADFRQYLTQTHREPIGVYLFDGPHSYADQRDGLTLAEPFLAERAVVIVDDTNWEQVRRANLDFIAESPFEYRMLLDVRTPKSGHPTFWNGLMVFQKQGRKAHRAAA